jgi:hypothetical protein
VHDSLDSTNGFQAIYAIMYLESDASGNLTGYTYDFHMGSTCSFYLQGTFDSEKQQLKAVNKNKIQKHFLHSRGRYKLSYEVVGDEEYLVGRIRQKGVHGFLFSFGGAIGGNLRYRKVKPEEYQSIQGYDVLKPYIDSPEKILVTKEFPQEEIEEFTEKMIVDESSIKEVKETKETRRINRKKRKRSDKLLKSHRVTSNQLTIEILDKKYEDGDRVSIYVNDVLFQFNVEVKNEPQQFQLTFPSNQKIHKVLFVANNLGKLPPNTATLRYTIDGVTYEETISTDKKVNKYLEFIIEY